MSFECHFKNDFGFGVIYKNGLLGANIGLRRVSFMGDELHIVYASDAAYAVPLGVSLYSLFKNNQDVKLFVHIYTLGIGKEDLEHYRNLAKTFGQKLLIEEMPDIEHLAGESLFFGKLSIVAYLRLFLVKLLPEDVGRVLWLDADTLIVGSVRELIKTDLEGFGGAAALNFGGVNKRLHGFGRKESYYNDGVFLFNLDYWRANGVYEKFLLEVARRQGKAIDHDQDYLNNILRRKIKTLSAQYNFATQYGLAIEDYKAFLSHTKLWECETYSKAELLAASKSVIIHHIIEPFFPNYERETLYKNRMVRPWYKNATVPITKLWREYLSETPWTQEDFPLYKKNITEKTSKAKKLFQGFFLFKAVRAIKNATVNLFIYTIPITRRIWVRVKFGYWER